MALKSVKMAVLAPMPSASVNTATNAKPGSRTSVRNARRTSFKGMAAQFGYQLAAIGWQLSATT